MFVLLLTGLGDNYRGYWFSRIIWRLCGFRTQVYKFDWEHDDGEFDRRYVELVAMTSVSR